MIQKAFFDFEYEFLHTDGTTRTTVTSQTWARTFSSNIATEIRDLNLSEGQILQLVDVVPGTVNCYCHE